MTPAMGATSADRLMANAGKTFYQAARLLPKTVRSDVIQLYAFCRRVDDLADELEVAELERRCALGALADAFEQKDPVQLHAAGWPFALQGEAAMAARLLVQAATQDLDPCQPQSQEALLAYAFGVAGTVGIMMAYVLRARPEGVHAAVALGMAMQLSNIARDVAEDLENGRIYLPAEWVTEATLQAALSATDPIANRRVLAATAEALALAERLYQAAFNGFWTLPLRIRWSILAAALCYREIGREVGRQGELAWANRVVITGRRKLWLIFLAGARLLLPRFWLPRRRVSYQVLGPAALSSLRASGLA